MEPLLPHTQLSPAADDDNDGGILNGQHPNTQGSPVTMLNSANLNNSQSMRPPPPLNPATSRQGSHSSLGQQNSQNATSGSSNGAGLRGPRTSQSSHEQQIAQVFNLESPTMQGTAMDFVLFGMEVGKLVYPLVSSLNKLSAVVNENNNSLTARVGELRANVDSLDLKLMRTNEMICSNNNQNSNTMNGQSMNQNIAMNNNGQNLGNNMGGNMGNNNNLNGGGMVGQGLSNGGNGGNKYGPYGRK